MKASLGSYRSRDAWGGGGGGVDATNHPWAGFRCFFSFALLAENLQLIQFLQSRVWTRHCWHDDVGTAVTLSLPLCGLVLRGCAFQLVRTRSMPNFSIQSRIDVRALVQCVLHLVSDPSFFEVEVEPLAGLQLVDSEPELGPDLVGFDFESFDVSPQAGDVGFGGASYLSFGGIEGAFLFHDEFFELGFGHGGVRDPLDGVFDDLREVSRELMRLGLAESGLLQHGGGGECVQGIPLRHVPRSHLQHGLCILFRGGRVPARAPPQNARNRPPSRAHRHRALPTLPHPHTHTPTHPRWVRTGPNVSLEPGFAVPRLYRTRTTGREGGGGLDPLPPPSGGILAMEGGMGSGGEGRRPTIQGKAVAV
eukprot:scaffold718_cov342-Pavlova_lutheri.AAC.35